MHTPGVQVLKSVHPTVKMCTQGAGCTLNFEHLRLISGLGGQGYQLNTNKN